MSLWIRKCKITSSIVLACLLTGCGTENADGGAETAQADMAEGCLGESAADGHVDFKALRLSNPDIFAWLYVPDADIDCPVLQSHESDTYYITHTPDGEAGEAGAVYTEMPNLMNLCDFNTVLHGRDTARGDWFYGLHRYEDAAFFQDSEVFYLYLPDNVLTYEIIAAYYDKGTDILRRYDYTTYSGCQSYLEDLYGYKSMNKNLREGWEDLTPYHFLVTLDGSVREDDTQYVVIGVLTDDAAGVIDRVIWE